MRLSTGDWDSLELNQPHAYFVSTLNNAKYRELCLDDAETERN